MVFPMLLFSVICAGMILLGFRTPKKPPHAASKKRAA